MFDNNIFMQELADYTAEMWELYPTDEEIEAMYNDAIIKGLA